MHHSWTLGEEKKLDFKNTTRRKTIFSGSKRIRARQVTSIRLSAVYFDMCYLPIRCLFCWEEPTNTK